MVAVAVPPRFEVVPRRLRPLRTPRPEPAPLRRAGASAACRRRESAATYRRRRIVAAGLLAAVALLALAGVRTLVGAPGGPAMRPIAAQVVVVRPGQTLWSIAVAHDPPHTPLLAFVDRLEAETHGRPLQVGQQLVLP